jgi:hypothetical protein
MRIGRVFSLFTFALFLAASTGCGSNDPPTIDPVGDKVAYVNSSFELTISGRDPDGDKLQFSYSADIADLKTREGFSFTQDGASALMRWTPRPMDIGFHAFDFSVSDGKESRSIPTVNIEVRFQPSSSAPVFREPLGTGTIVDLSRTNEVVVRVVVEDMDTPEVKIGEEDPAIANAVLDQDGPQTATWTWTPSPQQIAGDDRYVLTLSASDRANPAVFKNYLIVLKKPMKKDCPGAAPVVQHTAADKTTGVNLAIDAIVTDDVGIAYEPLLYYSVKDPGEVPDLAAMTQVAMTQVSGDAKNGNWTADIPNPVAGQAAGSSAQLFYVIVAQDNDDASGDCDHITQAPAAAAFAMKITNPGGEGGLGVCEPCTTDTQCGGPADNCLGLGSSGEAYCGKACTLDTECLAETYYCSLSEWQSVDGKKSRQCIPKSFECGGTTEKCVDDSFEPNDSPAEIAQAKGLVAGSYDLVSCPGATTGANEDWFVFDVAADAQVTVSILGGSTSNLNLQLVDKNGQAIATSATLGSEESVVECLLPGFYFIRVYSSDSVKNTYKLTFQSTAKSCSTAACADDKYEPDNDRAQARVVTVDYSAAYKVTDNAICAGNDDWYKLSLISGETIYATINFKQDNPLQDLDIRAATATAMITKCDETDTDTSGCDAANGQSSGSNENFKYIVPATGDYFLIVHGWQKAQNAYGICIVVNNQTACPALPKSP